ncbi:MAG: type II toxin-antitoxin system VapC family toxin [bacterium]|nr:type II toxin-antitoxin system VapC family toxin [bacterium]
MNQVLLDTHTWLFAVSAPKRLSAKARKLLSEPSNEMYLSVASIWEMAIKMSVGKLEMGHVGDLDVFVTSLNASIGVKTLPISVADACSVLTLPWYHRDPFDRMLVAQARANNLVLVSKDTELKRYGVKVLW